jgi:hypothetical protein
VREHPVLYPDAGMRAVVRIKRPTRMAKPFIFLSRRYAKVGERCGAVVPLISSTHG